MSWCVLKAGLQVCRAHGLLGLFLFCGLYFQLSSLQEAVQEKEALLEEQARQHQAELLKRAARSDLEAEMQQVGILDETPCIFLR